MMIKVPFLNLQVENAAVSYIKKNKKDLLNHFANDQICPSQEDPSSLFMAGSPGAGKTEYAINWLVKSKWQAVHIDTDRVRDWIPMYTGSNSNDIQAAASIGIEKLQDYCLKFNKSFILDATLANYDISKKNIER